jgi:hypothetical protein
VSEELSTASKSRSKRLWALVGLSLLGSTATIYACRMVYLLQSEQNKTNVDLYIAVAAVSFLLFANLMLIAFTALVKWRFVSKVRVKEDGRMHLIFEPDDRIKTIRIDDCQLLKKIYMNESKQPTEAIGVSVSDRIVFWLSEAAMNDYYRYARIHQKTTSS